MLRGPLFSRRSGVAAALAIMLIFLGCMSFEGTHVDRTEIVPPPEAPNPNLVGDGLLEQQGRGTIRGLAEEDVYFPVPYISPPNLELIGDSENVQLEYQRRDHFRIKNWSNNRHYVATFGWKAKGVKVLIGAPSLPLALHPYEGPVPDETHGPRKALPSEPVPVSQP